MPPSQISLPICSHEGDTAQAVTDVTAEIVTDVTTTDGRAAGSKKSKSLRPVDVFDRKNFPGL